LNFSRLELLANGPTKAEKNILVAQPISSATPKQKTKIQEIKNETEKRSVGLYGA